VADPTHLNELKRGTELWNRWRLENPTICPDLSGAELKYMPLAGADLRGANLSHAILTGADLKEANLQGAILLETNFSGAYDRPPDLTNADLRDVQATGATFKFANLHKINLSRGVFVKAIFKSAHLDGSIIQNANLRQADLRAVNFQGVDLTGSKLCGACLYGASFIDACLDDADLTGCEVFGASVWNVSLKGATQVDLVATRWDQPTVIVDNLEVAQFVHTLLRRESVRSAIDTITGKVVLILGRFTATRKAILDAIKIQLRQQGYVPLLFDFDKPSERDITETVSLLAHLSRFVIADITDARSIPQELTVIVPNLPSVPVLPILLDSENEYGMFEHFKRFPWVLDVFKYENESHLMGVLRDRLIPDAEQIASGRRPI
jgi:uncharacterized protein YjbI with pentapeptide repeats